LSGKQFSNSKLIAQIDRVLNDYGICGSQLKVEITEGVLIDNATVATDIFKQLKERQIQICLDDFGTGYSSLSYLHRFPIDSLKIDRSFISSLGIGLEKSEIVAAIVSLALNLGLSVVAEGLETEQQLSYLQSIQCSAGQGYHFARPLENTAASELLRHSAIPLSRLYSS
jgi:EAL domain-containing protein (putative c-di-GMP-specific phosphodiesterase class I)